MDGASRGRSLLGVAKSQLEKYHQRVTEFRRRFTVGMLVATCALFVVSVSGAAYLRDGHLYVGALIALATAGGVLMTNRNLRKSLGQFPSEPADYKSQR